MPDYRILPQSGSVSIEDALKAGKKDITLPARWIMIIGTIAGFVLPCCGFSLWLFPILVPGSIILSYVYTIWMTPKWRIWAYSGVKDIHQLQRDAELDQLLPKQSPMKMSGIMNQQQRALLARLQLRFQEQIPFIDDQNVQLASYVYSGSFFPLSGNKTPVITINDKGITTQPHGFYAWSEISNERVATKSYAKANSYTGGERSAGSEECFCFTCPDTNVEIPLSYLDITAAELDQMLYIHRGRYEQGRSQQ